MTNFFRVCRLTFKQRSTLAGIFVFSFMVALFWGANISAIYPFVQIFFERESVPSWVERQVEQGERKAAELRNSVGQLERQRASAGGEARRNELAREIEAAKLRLRSEEMSINRARRVLPYVNRYLPRGTYSALLTIVAVLVICTLLKCLFLVGSSVLAARLGERLTMELRRLMFRRLIEMDMPTFQQQRTGKLISHIAHEIEKVVKGVTTLLGKSLREPMKMLVCLLGAAAISWRLLLLTLIVSPLAALLMTRLARMIRDAHLQLMRDRAELFHRITESLSGLATVKAFNQEGRERARFHAACMDLYKRSIRISWLGSLISPNNELLGISIIALAIAAGGYLVLNAETHLLGFKITNDPLTPAGLIAFYAFIVGVADPVRKLSGVYGSLQGTLVAADRIYELLDGEPIVADPDTPSELPNAPCEVVFDHVSFQYQEGRPVLRDINLKICAGEALAIVGPNGCGKTTLANLMLRFYDPVKGAVRVNNLDLRDVRQRDLRRRIGVVTQHAWLFDDTVANNIRYGSMSATKAQVVEAAEIAHADQFIERELPQGYDSNVGEHGGQLSGGQRQRIALARAILRDPDLLILDEATSQIDPESETLIHQALRHFVRGRTTIIITHRMSTLALADRIVVMDEGRIVDAGTHAELIARCELFRRLHQSESSEAA